MNATSNYFQCEWSFWTNAYAIHVCAHKILCDVGNHFSIKYAYECHIILLNGYSDNVLTNSSTVPFDCMYHLPCMNVHNILLYANMQSLK